MSKKKQNYWMRKSREIKKEFLYILERCPIQIDVIFEVYKKYIQIYDNNNIVWVAGRNVKFRLSNLYMKIDYDGHKICVFYDGDKINRDKLIGIPVIWNMNYNNGLRLAVVDDNNELKDKLKLKKSKEDDNKESIYSELCDELDITRDELFNIIECTKKDSILAINY